MQMYYLMKKDPLSIRQVLYMSHVADVCPLPDFFSFAYLLHLHVSDHQTFLYKMQYLNDDFMT